MLYSYNATSEKSQRHSEQREESVAENRKPIDIQSNAKQGSPNRKTKRLVFYAKRTWANTASAIRVPVADVEMLRTSY